MMDYQKIDNSLGNNLFDESKMLIHMSESFTPVNLSMQIYFLWNGMCSVSHAFSYVSGLKRPWQTGYTCVSNEKVTHNFVLDEFIPILYSLIDFCSQNYEGPLERGKEMPSNYRHIFDHTNIKSGSPESWCFW